MKIRNITVLGISLILIVFVAGCSDNSSSTSVSTEDTTPSLALTDTEISGSILKVTVKDLSSVEGQFAVMVDFYDKNNVKVSTQTLRTPYITKGQSGAVKFFIPSDAKTFDVVAMAAIIDDSSYKVHFVDERVIPTPTPEPTYIPVKTVMQDTSILAGTTKLTLESKTDGQHIYTTGTVTNSDSVRHVIRASLRYISDGVQVGDYVIIQNPAAGTTQKISARDLSYDGFPNNTFVSVVVEEDYIAY